MNLDLLMSRKRNGRILPLIEGYQVISLLEKLDLYMLKNHLDIPDNSEVNVDALRYKMRRKWQEDDTLIDNFLATTDYNLKDEDKLIASSWKKHIHANFIFVDKCDDCNIFFELENQVVFAVQALIEDVDETLLQAPLCFIRTTLLPYKGRIIWDGLAVRADQAVEADMAKQLKKACRELYKTDSIIRSFDE